MGGSEGGRQRGPIRLFNFKLCHRRPIAPREPDFGRQMRCKREAVTSVKTTHFVRRPSPLAFEVVCKWFGRSVSLGAGGLFIKWHAAAEGSEMEGSSGGSADRTCRNVEVAAAVCITHGFSRVVCVCVCARATCPGAIVCDLNVR